MALFRSLVASAALAPAAASVDLLKIPIKKVPDERHVAHLLSSHAPPRLVSIAAASSPAAAAGRRLGRDAPAGDAEEIVLHDVANAQVMTPTEVVRDACVPFAAATLFLDFFQPVPSSASSITACWRLAPLPSHLRWSTTRARRTCGSRDRSARTTPRTARGKERLIQPRRPRFPTFLRTRSRSSPSCTAAAR